jgi:hypothetical protein
MKDRYWRKAVVRRADDHAGSESLVDIAVVPEGEGAGLFARIAALLLMLLAWSSATQLRAHLGMSRQRVTRMAERGVIIRRSSARKRKSLAHNNKTSCWCSHNEGLRGDFMARP